jgi:hypothetical protein
LARPLDDLSTLPWDNRLTVPLYRSASSNGAISRSGVRRNIDLPRSRQQEFNLNPATGSVFNSSDILQNSFNRVITTPRSSVDPHSTNHSLNHFLNDSNQPWAFISQPPLASVPKASAHSHPTGRPDSRAYRSPRSEVESIATGQAASDSGYHSRTAATQSVRSTGTAGYRSDFPAEVIQQFDTLQPFPVMPGSSPSAKSEKVEDRNSRSPSRSRGGKRTCERCEKVLKCPSDYKFVSFVYFHA